MQHPRRYGLRRCAAMRMSRTAAMVAAAVIVAAGCSSFGKSKTAPVRASDPNAYPANYRNQIATTLTTLLTNRADFHGVLISQPVLKPVGDNQHYVVCLRFSGPSQIKEKVVIFLDAIPNFIVDSKPEQCGDAAYAPFTELEALGPR
jgi:hypothetical protein